MEFDRSAVRHSLAVVPWEPGQFDVFVRCDDGQIEHYWMGEEVMLGPERLGGQFDGDPVAEWTRDDDGDGLRLHLLGRSGVRLVDWSWPVSGRPGWLGVPTVETLPGYCLSDPVAVNSGRLDVFAVGIEDTLRHWFRDARGWSGPESMGTDPAFSAPAAVSRAPGILDVFAVGVGGALWHWFDGGGGWQAESRGGHDLVGRPTAASYTELRLDVFAVRSGGVPVHWGWNGARWFDAEERLQMTFGLSSSVTASVDIQLVTYGMNRLTLVGRTTDNQLAEWTFQTPDRWGGVNPFSRTDTPFAACSSQTEQIDVFHRTRDGGFFHDFFFNEPDEGMGEPVAGSWESEGLDLAEPDPPPLSFTPAPVDPDLLLIRPRDLVLVGVRWDGFDVRVRPDGAAELVADGHGTLTVIFPPQHVAEEVVAATGRPVPSLDPATTAGFATWRAALSGASRVVVDLDGDEPIPLTVDGVLAALRRGSVRPGNGLLDDATAIEIPYGLVLSPHTPDGSFIRCGHPDTVVASSMQTVGLWQTRITADPATASALAGLVLHPLGADSGDPFPVPLRGGARARILREEPTARIDRLSLSALGGSLTASGSWPGFTWEHVAALGRDQRVRVTTQGVLYPFGHRAEFVEFTERVFESTAEGAIAHLRTAVSLRVVEPVRFEPDDAALKAAFPFSAVEIGKTYFEALDRPQWTTKEFPTPEVDRLEMARDQWLSEARPIYEQLYGDMGPGGLTPPTEDLAFGQTDDANEPFDPDDPESITRAEAALSYLSMLAQIAHIDAQIAALPFGGLASADVFFVPRQHQRPILFQVRLAGRLGDLHVSLPLVFVADVDQKPGLLSDGFQSLTDPQIADQVAAAYKMEGDGIVDVGGTWIDLVRAEPSHAADVCEVRRLHIVGAPHDGGYRPRLGAAPKPDEGDVPATDRWGFEVDLPAVRTLLGADRPPLTLAFSRALLRSAPDLKVPFQVPDTFPKLATNFAQNTARSGGLAAPDIVADGISRTDGPVSVAGLLAGPGGALDPKKVLSDSATLLGYKLSDLIDAAALTDPPQILSVDQPGLPPKVTLTWSGIKLDTESGSFVTRTDSQLDLTVVLGTDGQIVTCTVQHIALALPDRASRLIEVGLDSIVFTQTGDAAPTLQVNGVSAQFFGVLDLLKKLQEAIHLGDSGAHIEASSHGVAVSYTLPVQDVPAGVFQMSGLVLHAGIDVPFDGRPVSISLALASRAKPFNLSVLMFGGGGYVDVLIDRTGLRRLEIALEFGASLSMSFVIARGEVHALGGVWLVKDGDLFVWAGYIRFGGSVSVFGLVSVAVELTLTLSYQHDDHTGTNKLTGRATLVLEIDLTLFSDSVELDTGEWELIGASSARRPIDSPARLVAGPGDVPEEWRRYRAAFAEGSVR